MRKEASQLFKNMLNALKALAKAKSMSLKSRTRALKTRLIIFSLLRNKKVLMGSLSDKLHSLLHPPNITNTTTTTTITATHNQPQLLDHTIDLNNNNKGSASAMVVYQDYNLRPSEHVVITCTDLVEVDEDHHEDQCCYHVFRDVLVDGDQEDDKYPDWTHSMFDEDDDDDDVDGQLGCSSTSVIELVRNAKDKEGEEFRLEDEIDHVADLFIRKVHRHIRLEKQQSLKRFQEMLQRSV
ncbi:hypothetical protein Scep_020843 [Stephania cephalantha]|uniref:Uncharacterized protein n=1 Tax=Stephania cephalantha TaxID=152367 RepID=A0AAP0F374_9MAGN